jgi:PIN domain nuclease of toxin-antitoxin system
LKYILDASAVIAFIKGETGGDVVKKILLSESCCIHSANWIELFYIIHRDNGRIAADAAVDLLRQLKVSVTDISDEAFRRRVATIKLSYSALSLGDCYAVGLAEWLKGTVVTSDKRFSDAGEVAKVRQIR